jgi:hypothetical protein
LSREEWGEVQVRVLWLVLETVAYRLLGEDGMEFLKEYYFEAAKTWLNIMEKDYGIRAKKASTAKEAVKNYIDVGIAGWLFRGVSDFDLKEEHAKTLRIKVYRCPWTAHCIDMLENPLLFGQRQRKSGKDLLTCPRIGCFSAAVRLLAGKDCNYRLTIANPPKICEGEIRIR